MDLFAHLPAGKSSSDLLEGKSLYAGRRAPPPLLARKGSETIRTARAGMENPADPSVGSNAATMATAEAPAAALASVGASPPGSPVELLADYVLLNGSLTNHVFQGDQTAYVTGPVYLYTSGGGFTVVEGNTVVKYKKNVGAKLVFYGPVEFQTDFNRPAVFTAEDDRSVGQSYTFGSGSPTGYYASTALAFNYDGAVLLQHARFAYAQTAVKFHEDYLPTLTARHIQVRHCGTGLAVGPDLSLDVGNALFVQVDKPFTADTDTTVSAAHVTANRCDKLVYDHSGGYGHFAFTNSVFVNATNVAGSSVGSLTVRVAGLLDRGPRTAAASRCLRW